jgi:hypothetical protein
MQLALVGVAWETSVILSKLGREIGDCQGPGRRAEARHVECRCW